jgi:hypothetical protein
VPRRYVDRHGASELKPFPAKQIRETSALLDALPSSAEPSAAAFRRAVQEGAADGSVRSDFVDASVEFGSGEFRALANACSGRRQPERTRRAVVRFADALGLGPAAVEAALGWLSLPGHDVHFGLACGVGRVRRKLYFGGAGGRPSSPGLERALERAGLTRGLARETLRDGAVVAGVEWEQGPDPACFKVYRRPRAAEAARAFGGGALVPLLESEGVRLERTGLLICRRWSASGEFSDESLHVFIDDEPPEKALRLAARWAAASRAREELAWLARTARERKVRVFSFSESLDPDRPRRHVYLRSAD